MKWPDSDGSFALQVGALDRASVRAHVCALSDVALRSAAAARRWTVRGVRGGFYEMLSSSRGQERAGQPRSIFTYRIYTAYRFTVNFIYIYTGHPRFAAVPVACGNVRFPFIF